MATQHLPNDFKEFLRLLSAHEVEYLMVGGFAVAWHGYPRSTGDMDIWVRKEPGNAEKLLKAFSDFGFGGAEIAREIFL